MGSAGTSLGSQAGSAARFTRLLVKLAATHLFLDATSLHQLAESPHRFLNRFPIANH
jgi:hypothetical protein